MRQGTSIAGNTLRGLAIGIVGLALAGCQPVVAQPAVAAARAADEGAAIEKVIAAAPTKKKLQLFSTQPARLEAIERTPLHSKLPGYVKQVHVDLGDTVEPGQTLITLDVPEMEVELAQQQALVEQAAAQTRQARAALVAVQAAVATSKAQARQALAGVARAAADVARWKSEYSRLEQLAESGSLNRQLVDETRQKFAAAEAAAQETEAAVDSAQAAVSQAEAGVAKAEADIDAAQAHERVAQAQHDHSQTLLAYREIKAPFRGAITQRHVDPGHYVQPAAGGPQPLLVVARMDVIRVFAAVPEADAGLVDVGDAVVVQVQSLGGAELPGKVSRTAWALDDDSRSLVSVIDLDNADGKLRPGMYATAKVLLAEREAALVLPAAAVVRKEGVAFCFVVQGSKVVQTPVRLGIKVGDEWEIAAGLTGSESVCLTKAATLKDGQRVAASPPEPKK